MTQMCFTVTFCVFCLLWLIRFIKFPHCDKPDRTAFCHVLLQIIVVAFTVLAVAPKDPGMFLPRWLHNIWFIGKKAELYFWIQDLIVNENWRLGLSALFPCWCLRHSCCCSNDLQECVEPRANGSKDLDVLTSSFSLDGSDSDLEYCLTFLPFLSKKGHILMC